MRQITRMTLAIFALAAISGCGRKIPCQAPEEVVSTFYGSLAMGDTRTAFMLLAGADRRELEARAARASEKTAKPLGGADMLVPQMVELVGDLSGATFKPVKVEVGDVQEVEVTFTDGSSARATVVKEASCYRIPLGL